MDLKKFYLLLFFTFCLLAPKTLWAQEGFSLPKNKKTGKIKFELINNLIIIPVKINNVKLSFILDTGVSPTLLFGATQDTLQLMQTSKVLFRGLGKGDAVEAIKSSGNTINVGNAIDTNHSLYVVFDEQLNFSPRMGVPIHGILGYDFFKNFVITVNYNRNLITYTSPENFKENKKKRFTTYPLHIEKGRPYMRNISINQDEDLLMLLDSGSSDCVWVFDEMDIISKSENKNYFKDFLGLGLSGNIYGKRSRVQNVKIGAFSFDKVNIAIPEATAIEKVKMVDGRNGSIGSQILKRFNIIFNYPNNEISLKTNKYFDDPFYYNMSGITIEHSGMSIVKNKTSIRKKNNTINDVNKSGGTLFTLVPSYDVFLTPSVVVAEVRKNSAAALVDIRPGDELLSINGKPTYEYKLHEITSIFSSKEGKLIYLKMDRNGESLKKRFYLKKLF